MEKEIQRRESVDSEFRSSESCRMVRDSDGAGLNIIPEEDG